jgi:hypothetical protein
MMDEFMQMAKANTLRNLETCGVLAGSLVSEDLYTWSKDFCYFLCEKIHIV